MAQTGDRTLHNEVACCFVLHHHQKSAGDMCINLSVPRRSSASPLIRAAGTSEFKI
ncbi:unnamed protein product [Periconia digitata]|uniref:Uncharacterized protein n=1 Tax=Periconia digitata TaxID=1303443 RepID=A0A9W4URZ5_9PLEO|nr:unnamed protein product [Periconia digitata]